MEAPTRRVGIGVLLQALRTNGGSPSCGEPKPDFCPPGFEALHIVQEDARGEKLNARGRISFLIHAVAKELVWILVNTGQHFGAHPPIEFFPR